MIGGRLVEDTCYMMNGYFENVPQTEQPERSSRERGGMDTA